MAVLLLIFLAGLTVALLKFVDHYRSRDKYPPLPSVPSSTAAHVMSESAVFTQPGHISLDSSATGHEGAVHCDGGQSSYDGCNTGDGGASGHH